MEIGILIGLGVLAILVIIYGVITGTRDDDIDLEAQAQALKEWREQHHEKG